MYKRKQAIDAGRDDEDDEGEQRAPVSKKTKGKTGGAGAGAGAGEEGVASSSKAGTRSEGLYTNKQRVLVLSSRGITARYRHLLEDIKKLIPHHKKDNKLDAKGDVKVVNEIAEMKSCNQVIYLDTRKHQDLYMYLGQTPNGPSVKFHVVNVHTMDELKLTGNCMLGSRPILNFDSQFDSKEHWQLLRGLLTDAFGCPRGHPKSKPFVDRVMSFFIVKNSIWVRNYQIIDKSADREDKEAKTSATHSNSNSSKSSSSNTHLVEIGPRMVLIPIRIFAGSLGGATLYQNPTFVSPNEERSRFKKRKGDRFTERVEHAKHKKAMDAAIEPPADQLSNKRVFR